MGLTKHIASLFNRKQVSSTTQPVEVLATADAIARERVAAQGVPRTAAGTEMTPEATADFERQQRERIRLEELTTEATRRFGAEAVNAALASHQPRRRAWRKDGPLTDGEKSMALAALLATAGPETVVAAKPAAPPVSPTLPAPKPAAMAPKPTPAPTTAMLAHLVDGVFGKGTAFNLCSEPRSYDLDKFRKHFAGAQHGTWEFEVKKASYKPEEIDVKAKAARDHEKLKRFCFTHHLRVPGLDYSDCGHASPSPLTAAQQAIADRLCAEFFSTLHGDNPFAHSPAARAAREYAITNSQKEQL